MCAILKGCVGALMVQFRNPGLKPPKCSRDCFVPKCLFVCLFLIRMWWEHSLINVILAICCCCDVAMKEFVEVYVSFESPWEEFHDVFKESKTQKQTRDTVWLIP